MSHLSQKRLDQDADLANALKYEEIFYGTGIETFMVRILKGDSIWISTS
jgi:hypothetical protein